MKKPRKPVTKEEIVMLTEIKVLLNGVITDVVEIKNQTTKTNGRVTSLESLRDKILGGATVLFVAGGIIGFILKSIIEFAIK